MIQKISAILLSVTFIIASSQPVAAEVFSVRSLPLPGAMVTPSAAFTPMALKGMVINPQKPLEFQFLLDSADVPQNSPLIKEEANRLVRYFLTGLTIPQGDLWVNLSPYENDRIIPDALGQTELGRDLLAQDYILKQLTASMIYPESRLGQEFWTRVYKNVKEKYGDIQVPVSTFNKVWIVPQEAQIYEKANAVYVTKSTLKVMLDEDYTASVKNLRAGDAKEDLRAIILPEIEKEINTGKNFAPLRQIYQALILAKWYKETVSNGLLDAVYTNKRKISGINLEDRTLKNQIYDRYLQAYKTGVFNFIKNDGNIPRKYFCGGVNLNKSQISRSSQLDEAMTVKGVMKEVVVNLYPVGEFLDNVLQIATNNAYFILMTAVVAAVGIGIASVRINKPIRAIDQRIEQLAMMLRSQMDENHPERNRAEGILKSMIRSRIEMAIPESEQFLDYDNRERREAKITENVKKAFSIVMSGHHFDVAYHSRVTTKLVISRRQGFQLGVVKPASLEIYQGEWMDNRNNAMTALSDNGGIDLNQINLKRSGTRIMMRIDPAQLNSLLKEGFKGFRSQIVNIHAVQNPSVLFN